MTKEPTAVPFRPRVLVLVTPGVQLLDLAGPTQVFDGARVYGVSYELHFVASEPKVRSAQGLLLSDLEALPRVHPGDLILVPGAYAQRGYPSQPVADDVTLAWLRRANQTGVHIASVCTGALVLAQAGLLDGRRCTTHWGVTNALAAHHPLARVEDAALYITSGNVTTSAGVTSGIDMALALLERAHGPLLAARVARYLLVYHRRSGHASQESVFLANRNHLHPAVHRVQDHLAQHFASATSLDKLARLANMSVRGLHKAFKTATGLTPLAYQQTLRLEAARSLLADDARSVEDVARLVGFQDARQLRRLYKAAYGMSPREARLAGEDARVSPRGSAA
ncbi:GlxA family transcriptional regulator [Deinococcus pimensis]|uniref:GlxA family transcriptional regulator n=1 Tax=Deinococcus pimensis TaxID=309888 RepID=UPI0004BC608E|nr:DJ-1/PfpI family protein [Deinococcus pimensis]